jgi:hypothetical protein
MITYGVPCVSKGNERDEFHVLSNYVAMSALSPFPYGKMKWCEICIEWVHIPPHYPTFHKYYTMTHTPFSEFYKSIWKNVNSCC